jgi:predicted PolB exonuclease-like 3'-5' exonuclease
MSPLLAFDIETIPDVAGIRRVHGIGDNVDDAGVVAWFSQRRRASAGTEFGPLHLQQVVAIGCVLRDAAGVRIWSVGDASDSEPELIRRFFDGIEKYTPQLVSWNGSSFDLPVLHYRALIHGIPGCCYWDAGDSNRDFKFNNYLSRFHTRHTDLMDVLAGYVNRAWAPLDEIAVLCGLPGKLGMDGSKVHGAFKRGEIEAIRNYCETDVANTYALWLRFQLIRGALMPDAYAREVQALRDYIAAQDAPHWKEFAAAWK